MANFFSDVFTYAGTATLQVYSSAWAYITGFSTNLYVNAANICYLTEGSSNAYYRNTVTPPSADYSVSADAIPNTLVTNNYAAVTARCSASAFTLYEFRIAWNGGLQLSKFVAGTNTVLGTSSVSVVAGVANRIEIVVEGNQISGYVDGILKIGPVTDSSISAAGHPGVLLKASTPPSYTVGWALDNFSADTVDAAATTHEITISNSVQANTVSDVAIDNGTVGTHNITISSAQQVNTLSPVAIQQTVPGSGTITTPEVRDWETRNLKTGLTGVQVDVRSIETGALIVRKTGLTTHATTAVCTITDAAIPNVTLCEVMMRCPDGSKGVWDLMSV